MNERLQYEEQFSQRQIETFRSWDNVRKMRCMFELYELAKHRLRMAVRARHSDWNDEEVERRVRELVTGQPLVQDGVRDDRVGDRTAPGLCRCH